MSVGNFISSSMQLAYGYAPSGAGSVRPHAVITTGQGYSATYDANGNQLTRIEVLPGGRYTYTQTWDAENRLASISAGGVVTTYTYNGDGARVRVASGNSATVYVGSTYEVITSTGVTTTYYYLGAQRVAMRTSAGVTWLAGDHLGSASLATNSAGQKVSDERYYPFGGTRSGSMPTDYQFTGQKNDGGTGLYYYGARYYDPVSGRFISADSIVPSPGKPQALNRYSYVYNNPVKYTDPTGHMVGCGAGDDTCGYSDPPTSYPSEKRRQLLYDFGKRASAAVTGEGMDPALAFVNLTYLAADLNRSNMGGFVSDLDCMIDGHCWGPDQSIFTIGFGPQFASIGGWLDQNAFPGTGSWSPDYHDNTGNQMYHFWFYVAVSYFDDPGLALLGNAWHDPVIRNPFFQLFGLGEPVYDLRDKNKPNLGVSLKDYDLGVAGAYLGWALRSNLLSPEQVPPWIRFTLTQAPARFGRASQ